MARHIRIYVKNEMFNGTQYTLSTSNRRYSPTLKDIRNHMYKASVKLRFAKLDQANLDMKIQDWQRQFPNDNFYFRSYGQKVEDQELDEEYVQDIEDEIKVQYRLSITQKMFLKLLCQFLRTEKRQVKVILISISIAKNKCSYFF